jgi:hypothetical protein
MCLRWSDERDVGDSSLLQVLVGQSADRHDSEHRGSAVVACAPVSWNRRRWVMGLCLNKRNVLVGFVDFCRDLGNNQLTGTIPSTVGQLSSLQQL